MNIQKNVLLAPYTSFKIGGPANFFCEASSKDDLVEVTNWAKKEKLSFFFLGGGSNVLISDQGFAGLVIKLANDTVDWEGNICRAGAGVTLSNLINEAKRKNLGGMEWAYGIPATLGGAVRGNAGAYDNNISHQVNSVEFFDLANLKFQTLEKEECNFAYRKSVFQKNPDWLIWEITLEWKESDREKIESLLNNKLERRKKTQPLDSPSAGSYFRNPNIENLEPTRKEKIIQQYINDKIANFSHGESGEIIEKTTRENIAETGTIPAGFFIDQTGLKGCKIGGAQVSTKHTNFIINTGNAKAEEVIILASIIKQKVRNKFGVQLHEEVEYVGF